MQIQQNLGSDIAMCLDERPPFHSSDLETRTAVERTLRWAERCKKEHVRADQALFAIVQGGGQVDLRAKCAEELVKLDFPGYALGGFSVGETTQQMVTALDLSTDLLPLAKPRYLMGVGRPEDILLACGARRGHVRLRIADKERSQCDGLHGKRNAETAKCGA